MWRSSRTSLTERAVLHRSVGIHCESPRPDRAFGSGCAYRSGLFGSRRHRRRVDLIRWRHGRPGSADRASRIPHDGARSRRYAEDGRLSEDQGCRSDRLGQKGIKRDIDQRRGPQPTAQPVWTIPTPRPRYLSRITAPISTAPAAHSPPKPSPCAARSTKSCSKFWAKAQRKVNIEYHKIVICSHAHPAESVGQGTGKPPA